MPRMKGDALLIHGLGNTAYWWDSFLEPLKNIGINPRPLRLPSVDNEGPIAWKNAVISEMNDSVDYLIGHSLGAVVALAAAQHKPVSCIILLAMPFYLGEYRPKLPANVFLNEQTRQFCATFIAQVSKNLGMFHDQKVVHFLGEDDICVDRHYAIQLPINLRLLPNVGHDLRESPEVIPEVCQFLIKG